MSRLSSLRGLLLRSIATSLLLLACATTEANPKAGGAAPTTSAAATPATTADASASSSVTLSGVGEPCFVSMVRTVDGKPSMERRCEPSLTCDYANAVPDGPGRCQRSGAGAAAATDAATTESSSKACLMVNVCTCNLGCAAINVPPSMVREGTRAKVVSGALKGEDVKIIQVTDAAGSKVLALTDLKHDFACSLSSADKSLLGYACSSGKSGPVPAKACAKGCD